MKVRQYLVETYQPFTLLPAFKGACKGMQARVFAIDGLLLASFTDADYASFATRRDAHFLVLVNAETAEGAEEQVSTIIEKAQEIDE